MLASRIPILAFLFITFSIISFGQVPASNDKDWIRVSAENGISVEIPSKYKYYFNKDGTVISQNNTSNRYPLTNMQIVNAYYNESLISIESYKGTPKAMKVLFEEDARWRQSVEKSEVKLSELLGKQMIVKSDQSYMVRRYFESGNIIVVLTAASRGGETTEIKHFLDSLILIKGNQDVTSNKISPISTLKMTEIDIVADLIPNTAKFPKPSAPAPVLPAKDNLDKAIFMLYKPKAPYTDAARKNNVQGSVQLKITFAEDGSIPRIVVRKELPDGLVRETLISAIRIKFLPTLEAGKPVSKEIIFEYGFSIY